MKYVLFFLYALGLGYSIQSIGLRWLGWIWILRGRCDHMKRCDGGCAIATATIRHATVLSKIDVHRCTA